MAKGFFLKRVLFGLCLFSTSSVFGTTCSNPSSSNPLIWDPQVCDFEALSPEDACIFQALPDAKDDFRLLCAANAAGCDQIQGGCIGTIEPSHWALVFTIEKMQLARKRCRC